ncbi:group II intron maturase-specific domain-containing protein [Providencia hangzhouensis]|uniref:group II intron maturase-specific domain-containing protein n=1 Tax=Providencia hangzhouensis TaxID=3031799 RepID=UPI0034DDB569
MSNTSVERLKDKIRSLTTGYNSKSIKRVIEELTPVFRYTQVKGVLGEIDSWINRKLRCLL